MSSKETEFRINISRENAERLKKSGEASPERRGNTKGAGSYRLSNDDEASRMEKAGEASRERIQHPTENIAQEYKRGSDSAQ